MLLPRLVPLGDGEEAESLLALAAGAEILPPVVPPLQRRLKLTRLVSAWARTVNRTMLAMPEGRALLPRSLAEAFALSADLAATIDEFGIHDIGFEAVGNVDLHKLDRYWELTAQFLRSPARIGRRCWPRRHDRGECPRRPAGRCDDRVLGAARHGPVIAAGSTGSIPATARLMLTAITQLPKGAVVLPDLDLAMDDASWQNVADLSGASEAAHPQAILSQFAQPVQPDASRCPPARIDNSARRRSCRPQGAADRGLPPVATTPEWARSGERMSDQARRMLLANVEFWRRPDERLEALAIAAVLRRALETPERPAALVTPDRSLAERVCA